MGKGEKDTIENEKEMKYAVVVTPRAIKELNSIPGHIYKKIVTVIDNPDSDPRPRGTIKLKVSEQRWRIRIADYRILYEVDDGANSIIVYRVVHRKEAYR